MMPDVYFFDSYAIIEILKGNSAYLPYAQAIIVTTKLQVFEVFYSLLRDVGKQEAADFLKRYMQYTIDFDASIIERAALLKLHYRKNNLSMTDCVGYCLALQIGIKFLTGDRQFEHFAEVEFVK